MLRARDVKPGKKDVNAMARRNLELFDVLMMPAIGARTVPHVHSEN